MQRKATKNTRGPNQAEKDFQGWLKSQYCCVSGEYGVQVHHCKGATFKHKKVLIGHWFCIPLSEAIHNEYHSGSKPWIEKYGLQRDLWVSMILKYQDETGVSVPDDVAMAIGVLYA